MSKPVTKPSTKPVPAPRERDGSVDTRKLRKQGYVWCEHCYLTLPHYYAFNRWIHLRTVPALFWFCSWGHLKDYCNQTVMGKD